MGHGSHRWHLLTHHNFILARRGRAPRQIQHDTDYHDDAQRSDQYRREEIRGERVVVDRRVSGETVRTEQEERDGECESEKGADFIGLVVEV